MKRATAFTVLLLALLTFGCLGCVLTLTDYFAPAFSQSEGSAVLNIETYIDGQNQPTHPAVIDMKREWNGYRYWMSYSPYPNADGAEENPCIGVSNDMIHWTTPDGLYNPIAFNEETACDELKDPHIVYNNDLNRMEIWYLGRTDSTIKSGGTLLLFRKVSSDGVHWSEYEIMRVLWATYLRVLFIAKASINCGQLNHLPQEEKVHWPIRKAQMVIHGPRSKNALSEAIME